MKIIANVSSKNFLCEVSDWELAQILGFTGPGDPSCPTFKIGVSIKVDKLAIRVAQALEVQDALKKNLSELKAAFAAIETVVTQDICVPAPKAPLRREIKTGKATAAEPEDEPNPIDGLLNDCPF